MYVVIDEENDMAYGPFDSKAEADEYFKLVAQQDEWIDVLDLISKTGSAFGSGADALRCVELSPPSARVRSLIQY